ncbi:unnamed protein product [Laminaria digitata]
MFPFYGSQTKTGENIFTLVLAPLIPFFDSLRVVDVPEDACNPNPCLKGGSCSLDPAGGHECSCLDGYGGMACQIDTSCKRRRCQNKRCLRVK